VQLNRQLGYTGQILIHPSHVPIVNEIYTPTADDIAYHQGLLAAMEKAERQGAAVAIYQGVMVDLAMVKTSRQILDLAQSIGALD
jgi:citrate lyase subunit beta/citryl-CoA lyase